MDNWSVEPTIFFMKKISFFLTFLWPFYGQSFSKTVRGPFTFFSGQISFFVIFLCDRVKPFLAIPVAMVTLICSFKTIIFCICISYVDYLKYAENKTFLSCWKEIICFDYALFV